MGMSVCSAWGMTEMGAATVTEPTRALDKSGVSDGYPLRGIDLKVIDVAGNSMPLGETGTLLLRGASLFGGYLKRPHLNHVDVDGWFDTGDLAFLDSEGYVRIVGRTKDLVIRGGENIPVVEIENLLYKHPSVSSVAVVGFPDRRLGERVCAFVALKPGDTMSMEDMTRYLDEQQVARQYYPERLEVVEDLPRTPTGKIQKFLLRNIAKSFGDAP
jgi:cyclohexanecarboxylate-CoA ligase